MASHVYVLLFRGINVGGNKIVKMETLRKVLSEEGFEDVATYIQSGNVILRSELDEDAVAKKVVSVFDATFGFSSRPTILSLAAWKRAASGNPFASVMAAGNQVHAVFLDGELAKDALEKLEALASTEQLALEGAVLYLYTPDGFGRSEVSKAFEKTLKVPWTARNMNTVDKLLAMAEDAAKG